MEEKNVLSAAQFGFRQQRDTEIVVTLLLDEVTHNTDAGKMTGAIFVDLKFEVYTGKKKNSLLTIYSFTAYVPGKGMPFLQLPSGCCKSCAVFCKY